MAQPLPVSLITVTGVARITPHMVRITFTGDDLAGSLGDAPDQQVKLCFPKPGHTVPRLPEPSADGDVMRWYQAYLAIPEGERPWMRSYTVRGHDPQRVLGPADLVRRQVVQEGCAGLPPAVDRDAAEVREQCLGVPSHRDALERGIRRHDRPHLCAGRDL
jgi:hypothetical protein